VSHSEGDAGRSLLQKSLKDLPGVLAAVAIKPVVRAIDEAHTPSSFSFLQH